MATVYKGVELELPLSDEHREWLIGRGKDTLINQLDRQWANIKKAQDEAAAREAEEEVVEEEAPPYEEWTNDELKEEIDTRNVDRADEAKISPASGKKADLVAALEADDEAHAE